MGLSTEEIQALYAKKSRPPVKKTAQGVGGVTRKTGKQGRAKMSRRVVHWAKLPPNYLVYHIAGPSIACESSGCGAPSYYRVRGQPLCQLHIVFALVHEINLLSNNGSTRPTGVPSPDGDIVAADSVAVATADIPVVLANIIEESDGDNYL